jgi:hypothetical protein
MVTVLISVSIRTNLFVAGGTDSSAYISAARLWQRGELYRANPLQLLASWPRARESTSPVGYRSGPVRGTEVPVYPAGFPLMIAAATALGGPMSAHLVAPLMGGVLVWCAFVLARLVGGNLAGLIAAGLTASSPVVLLHTVDAMSDVPASACWAAAWLMATRGTAGAAAAAGLMTSLAILIRPNLAPLAFIPAVVLFHTTWRASATRVPVWRAGAVFVATAAIGPALVVWSQAVLYGSPFTPGYVEWESFFSADRIGPNSRMYLRLLAAAHTVLPLAGLAMTPLVMLSRDGMFSSKARVVASSATAIVLANFVLYLPYLSFDRWPFLRFLLPGLVALFVLFGSLVALVTRRLWRRARWVAWAIPLTTAIVALQGLPFTRFALQDWRAQTRVRLMGHYLREVLPPNAAVLSFVHSGAVAHYTGREVVRLDLLEPGTLDAVIDDLLRRHYHPVLVLDQALEVDPFRQRFSGSRVGRLDWTPRAVFTSGTSIWYFDVLDRPHHQQGERAVVDVVQ